MPPFMQAFHAQAYALMRIVVGLLFLWHGTQKLFGFPLPPPPVPPFVINIAGPIELVCGFLVMVGLFAGWAAFLCSGLMAFAYWMVHGTQALGHLECGRRPKENLDTVCRNHSGRKKMPGTVSELIPE